jgi:hypothetical protein
MYLLFRNEEQTMHLPHELKKKLEEVRLQMTTTVGVSGLIGVGLLTAAIF